MMLLLALCVSASAQTYDEEYEAESFTLDKPLKPDKSYHYTASGIIDLTPGFDYAPDKGKMALFEIDPMGVYPPQGGVTTNVNVFVPNTGTQQENAGVVSLINGSVNVSSLGGALYTVPIELPSGINGMQPDLSVVYNSQAGNGLLGYGWDLAGISSITRTGSTLYHDGRMTAADFSDGDRFLLDGQRLIECGTSGDTILYKTEQDVFSKILFYGSGDNSVFKVMNEDGTVSIYGGSTSSKLLAKNRDAVIEWKIYTISDRNGNTIKYNYDNSRDSGEINIDYIEYTNNDRAGISPAFRVEFEYENDRDDQYHYYIAGNKVQYKKAIEKISIRKGEDVVCHYGFKYGFYKFLKLVKITKVKGGVQASPINITWDNDPILNTNPTTNPTTNPFLTYYDYGAKEINVRVFDDCVFPCELDGDGLTDIISVPYKSYNGMPYTNQIPMKVYLNNKIINGDNNSSPDYEMTLPSYVDWIHVADMNGDGIDEMIVQQYSHISMKTTLTVYEFSNSSGFSKMASFDFPFRNIVKTGDFLGNGMMSCMVLPLLSETVLGEAQVLRYDKLTGEYACEGLSKSIAYKKYNVLADDFTGDGKTDIMIVGENQGYVYSVVQTNSGWSLQKIIDFSANLASLWVDKVAYSGDFNADGKADIIVENSNSKDKYVLLSGGTCFTDKIKVTNKQLEDVVFPEIDMYNYCMNYPGFLASYGFDFIDIDSDGRTDMVYHDQNGTDFYRCFTVDKSDESRCKFAERRHHPYDDFIVYNKSIAVGCFVKSSSVSMIGWRSGHPIALFYSNVSKTNSVWKITDRFTEKEFDGNVIEFTYDFLIPDGSGFYTKTSGVQHNGMRYVAMPLLALKSCTTEYCGNNGNHKYNTTSYRYTDAVYHKDGHGLIGFMNVVATNSFADEVVSVNSSHYEAATMGYNAMLLPSCDTTYVFINGKRKCLETNEYKFDCVRCSQQANVNGDRLLVVRPAMKSLKTNRHDPYANSAFMAMEMTDYIYGYGADNKYEYSYRCTEEQTYSGDKENLSSTDFVFKTSTKYSFMEDDYVGWIINRVSVESKIQALSKKPVITKKVKYGYSKDNPFRVETVTTVPSNQDNDPLAVRTQYEYDAIGNVIRETVSAPNSKYGEMPRTTAYGYDSGRRLVTSKTADPDGLAYGESYEYNLYDMVTSTTGVDGLVTTRETDNPFGSTVKQTNPDGTECVEALRWDIECEYALSKSQYYKWNKATGGVTTWTFYHKTGKPLRIVTKDENENPIFVDMDYDTRGRLKKQSDPYRKGCNAKWTEYGYDDLGRTTMVTAPDGTKTVTSYAGFTTTTSVVTPDGKEHKSSKTTNCLGWVVQSVDADGAEVSYSYYSDGKLESATTSGGGVKVIVKYDNAGNRVSLEDADYGKTISRYDAYGQLIEQVSPKGDKTLFVYDNLGRMTSKHDTGEGMTTNYIYNENESKGTLAKVSHDNDIKEFTYDEFQRPVSTKETIDGVGYVTTLEYDKASRVCRKVFPSGYELNYKYYISGRKHSVLDSRGHLLWHTDEVNSMGQLVKATTGNGAEILNTFDAETHRLTGNVVSKNIQDFVYRYDKFGNLAARKDSITDMEETFTYDNINRLTGVTLNDKLHSGIKYDKLGRMVKKQMDGKTLFDAASFSSTKPHAMVKAVTYKDVFPKDEQEIDYTSFDKVGRIEQGCNTITYTYGIDNQRVGMTEIVDGKKRVKTYVGGCEFITDDGVEKILTYLTGPYGVFAVVVEEAGVENIHYIYADHLGSWTTITDSIGNVEQRQSFDAWGNRRNSKTWSGPATDEPMFDRGFTGHEHLYAFGLINMNGRVYDPLMSSFLSPDNYVQDPTSQQGFNRYAYCFYNPLKYVDPTGERCYGPSEAEIVQMAINEARQRCWGETYRMLKEQEAIYQQIKNGQHPFGWGGSGGGGSAYNSSKQQGGGKTSTVTVRGNDMAHPVGQTTPNGCTVACLKWIAQLMGKELTPELEKVIESYVIIKDSQPQFFQTAQEFNKNFSAGMLPPFDNTGQNPNYPENVGEYIYGEMEQGHMIMVNIKEQVYDMGNGQIYHSDDGHSLGIRSVTRIESDNGFGVSTVNYQFEVMDPAINGHSGGYWTVPSRFIIDSKGMVIFYK